jgi:hypothetical protein
MRIDFSCLSPCLEKHKKKSIGKLDGQNQGCIRKRIREQEEMNGEEDDKTGKISNCSMKQSRKEDIQDSFAFFLSKIPPQSDLFPVLFFQSGDDDSKRNGTSRERNQKAHINQGK